MGNMETIIQHKRQIGKTENAMKASHPHVLPKTSKLCDNAKGATVHASK